MESKNVICLWLTKFDDADQLASYIKFKYNDDGDATSKFAEDIGLEYFDEDFIEYDIYQSRDKLLVDIQGVSYYDLFKDELIDLLKSLKLDDYNSIICLFGQTNIYGVINFDLFEKKFIDTNTLKFLGKISFAKK